MYYELELSHKKDYDELKSKILMKSDPSILTSIKLN